MYDDISLIVTTGIHQGARFSLHSGEVTVGRHGDCDIVLADPTVADRHMRILRDGKRFIVDSLDAAVDLKHRDRRLRVEPEYSQLVVPPILMKLGDVVLQLTPQHAAAPAMLPAPESTPSLSGLLSKPLIPAGFAAVCLAVLLFTGMGSFSPSQPVLPEQAERAETSSLAFSAAQAESQPIAVNEMTTALAPSSPTTYPTTPAEMTVPRATEALRYYLISLELDDAVEVLPGDNSLIARGVLSDDKFPRWTEAHIWYDGRFGAYVPLLPEVTRQAEKTRPKEPILLMRALYLGDTPYIIARNGQKYFQGSVLNNGWMVEKINSDSVTVTLGERRVSLKL